MAGSASSPVPVHHTDQQHDALCRLEEGERIVEGARRFRAAVPRGDDGLFKGNLGGRRRHDHHRPSRGEQTPLDQRVLADQRIPVAGLTENRQIDLARERGEVVRELLAHALHEPALGADARGSRARLEVLERRLALRFHAFEHLAHVGEPDIGAVKRQQRLRGKGDPDQMRILLLGQRHGERDARLRRLRAVHINNDVVEAHRSPPGAGS